MGPHPGWQTFFSWSAWNIFFIVFHFALFPMRSRWGVSHFFLFCSFYLLVMCLISVLLLRLLFFSFGYLQFDYDVSWYSFPCFVLGFMGCSLLQMWKMSAFMSTLQPSSDIPIICFLIFSTSQYFSTGHCVFVYFFPPSSLLPPVFQYG